MTTAAPFRTRLSPAILALTGALLAGPMPAHAAERIVFPYENASDLRGLLNAFVAFQQACLAQPVTEGLAETLVPEGYQVVSRDLHYWGEESNAFPGAAVLSKTGREEDDFAGGHPIVDLAMPRDGKPDGDCQVVWRRGWDYPAPRDAIMLTMAVRFDAWVSYYLQAILATRPIDGFAPAESYSITSDWLASCWEPCSFQVILFIHPEDGIDLTMTRREVLPPVER